MNIDLRLPSEYVEILQQHVAATGGDIDTLVSDIVADSLQAEVESARSKQISPGSFAEWLQQWGNRHPRLEHDIDSAANQSTLAAANEGSR